MGDTCRSGAVHEPNLEKFVKVEVRKVLVRKFSSKVVKISSGLLAVMLIKKMLISLSMSAVTTS